MMKPYSKMSFKRRFIIFLGFFTGIYLAYVIKLLTEAPPIPAMPDDVQWGIDNVTEIFKNPIRPFKISLSQKIIDDLNQRLDKYLEKNITPPLENAGFRYGFNTNYLREIISYWRHDYSWREREKLLNQYPQFKIKLNGLDIHFLRIQPNVTSVETKILPLLILHGWPGSFREFYELIPFLTTPRDGSNFVFEIIIPSLPGFAFSEATTKPGLGPAQMAVVMGNLMRSLNITKYYAQGGDWGSVITKQMGVLYPENVLGVHFNLCGLFTLRSQVKWILGSFFPFLIVERKYQHLMYPYVDKFLSVAEDMGYFHLQATEPDTIGLALEDTPAGLAAYILEKFSYWTNDSWKYLPDGGLTKKFSLDSLLDVVSIYWVTGSITTSARLYAETISPDHLELGFESLPIKVPTACARFHNDLVWQPEFILKDIYQNLLQITDYEDGGHFAAMEDPKLLSDDIWSAVQKFEIFNSNEQNKD